MAKLFLAAGMPRAGSGWHYNLLHDLVVAGGGEDGREVRRRFLLAQVLTEVNLNIRVLSPQRLFAAHIPVHLGRSYAIKTHSAPTRFARKLIEKGELKVSYIYRDPRAALLSALEYGDRAREAGRSNAFSKIENFDDGLTFMQGYLKIWEQWTAIPEVHNLRYEDLLSEYEAETSRLVSFLGMDAKESPIREAIAKHHADKAGKDQKGQHFQHGEAERFRKVFSGEEMDKANAIFGGYLEGMEFPK